MKRGESSEVELDDAWDVGAEEGQKTKVLAGHSGTASSVKRGVTGGQNEMMEKPGIGD